MRKISAEMFFDDSTLLVLLTTDTLVDGIELKAADFRDIHALLYRKAQAFIGCSRIGLKLGQNPVLINGVWYISYSEQLTTQFASAGLQPSDCALEIIEI